MSSNSAPTDFDDNDFVMNGAHVPVEDGTPSMVEDFHTSLTQISSTIENSNNDPRVAPGDLS